MRDGARSLTVLTLAVALSRPVVASVPAPAIRAVAGLFPPAVIEEDGRVTGFRIDLWEEVARRLGTPTGYRIVQDADAAHRALRDGEADDFASGALHSVQHAPEFDFTYPIADSWLQVMVRGPATGVEDLSLLSFLRLVVSCSMLYWPAMALVLVVVLAHLIWFLDRSFQPGEGTREKHFPGIFGARGSPGCSRTCGSSPGSCSWRSSRRR